MKMINYRKNNKMVENTLKSTASLLRKQRRRKLATTMHKATLISMRWRRQGRRMKKSKVMKYDKHESPV